MRLVDKDFVLSQIGAYADHPNEELVNNLAIAFDIVCDAPTIESPTWIPCSERLPEENKRVLITTAWGHVTIGWIKQNIWSTDLIVNLQDFVLAWMPLPKPWKGADDEDV